MISTFIRKLLRFEESTAFKGLALSICEKEVKIFGKNFYLQPLEQLAFLQKKLEEKLGKEGLELLYQTAKEGFSNLAKELEGLSDVRSEYLIELQNLVKHLGFGNVKVIEVNDRECKGLVRVEENPFPDLVETKGCVDYLLAGIIAGYFCKYFEKNVECKEVACKAEGKRYCEFIIQP
jgi:predicted hydrocarbon binding protein